MNNREQKRLLVMNEVLAGRMTGQEAVDVLGCRRERPFWQGLWLVYCPEQTKASTDYADYVDFL